jgi:ACS family tartrate transporter-like MFS transporter
MNEEDRVFAKCAWRLIPLIAVILFANFLDRVNAGFAALTMNKDLGFTPAVFGFGAGIVFLSYSLFQVPANIVLARVGAKRFVFSIMVLWAVFSASTAFVREPTEFYILRFLLGAAESGFFPGMMYYLSLWFPASYRARFAAMLMVGTPAAFIFGGPVSTLLLDMDGIAGLYGWQWMFLMEGVPVLLLAVAVLKLLPDAPNHAPFLTADEKDLIAARLAVEDGSKPAKTGAAFRDTRIFSLALVLFVILGAIYGLLLWLPLIVRGSGTALSVSSWRFRPLAPRLQWCGGDDRATFPASVCGISRSRCSSARRGSPWPPLRIQISLNCSRSVPPSWACSAVCPLSTTFPQHFFAAVLPRPA